MAQDLPRDLPHHRNVKESFSLVQLFGFVNSEDNAEEVF